MRLDLPRCISETIECPVCGASAGHPCNGIKVHPEYGPVGVHVARLEALRAQQAASAQPAEDEDTSPEPAVQRGRTQG